MTENRPQRNDIAPSVLVLLAAFHEVTRLKLELAPVDSNPVCERADGSLCEIGADGWPTEYDDDLDEAEAITVESNYVHDSEEP
ncbi:hypothetical protein ACQP1G_36785 [Nocardia sp. CA-107356]|uniref:hypothetical protein n=1 Tax=Nocardia sp. CA-107356 TaxID=3239972 RepID=UPI003D8BAB0D